MEWNGMGIPMWNGMAFPKGMVNHQAKKWNEGRNVNPFHHTKRGLNVSH